MNGHARWTGLVLASVVLGAAACSSSSAAVGSSSSPASTSAGASKKVSVNLNQWSVTPSGDPTSGSVTFTVTNDGTVPHEFVVLKTKTPAADIPVASFEGESERINEDTEGMHVDVTVA
jgi:hypothetical protein